MCIRRTVLLLLAVVPLVAAGCSSDTDEGVPDADTSTTSNEGQDRDTGSDVTAKPQTGECHNTPPSGLEHNDWVDDTPVVDCSRPHTVETVEVIEPLEEPSRSDLKHLSESCESPAMTYLNSQPGPSTVGLGAFIPSAEQFAAGERWVDCVALVTVDTQFREVAVRTGSLSLDVGGNPEFVRCLNERPEPSRVQQLATCTKPHIAEMDLRAVSLDPGENYPTPSEFQRAGEHQCADRIVNRPDASRLVTATQWFASEEQWSGGTIYGGCWIYRSDGKRLPPL